ncbi:polyamine ABC transporter substrate-binding protein [Rhizobium sp. Leaf341]|uniref:polyamine ABC transporter substrate-binding protein n=1 Tax=Rhizobium sp. Leaf341 TaxID=1736344 RepID=UPI000714DA44|nr:spermidine/putrescine ABC transporter substrate-binding protein [Rhizobium sp. Leaf341]KQR77457.1 spermidine/putrescine ABC transporter substrate-binding protein [Rhizobium sp. Leaf341]
MRQGLAATALLLCLFGGTAPARAETLNLLIWEAYIDPAILSDWTAATGIAVRQIYFDSGDARDEILADPNSNIDLSVVGENGSALFGKRGILAPIDVDGVPSLKDYATQWTSRCGGYGAPYLWGTMGIVYRSDKIGVAPSSWKDLMQPAPALKKHIAMYDDHNEAFVAPLVLLGKSINANDPETLKEAFELMKGQAPSVLTYDYVITSIDNPDYGHDIYMALAYSGDQKVLNEKTGTPGIWRYVVPHEGTLSWLDCLAVTAASPRKAQAMKLLDFILSAKSAARNAQTLGMPASSTAALALLPDAVKNDPAIYTPDDILKRSQYQTELSVSSIQTRRRIISAMANFQ